jgi:hypothetical protein
MYVATGIVFIIWHHRYATNATILRGPLGLGDRRLVHSRRELRAPVLQSRQSSRASDPDLAQGEPRETGSLPRIQIAGTGTFIAAAVTFAA